MKPNIMHLSENGLILIDEKPMKVGLTIEIEIRLPKESLIDKLSLKGEITKSETIDSNGGKKNLQEVPFLDLAKPDSLVLEAYVKYLERENSIDELYSNLDFKGIVKNFKECKEEIVERLALAEFTHAKDKEVPFH